MKFWLVTCILSAAVAAGTGAQGTGAQGTGAQGPRRSVWDSVYTEIQAKRGETVSGAQCTSCHGDGLRGGEAAPALVGDVFNANWEGVALGDLFERIRISMPQDKPGSLSRQQNVDVVAFMLKAGKFPAGDTELATDTTVLAQITFVSNRPQP